MHQQAENEDVDEKPGYADNFLFPVVLEIPETQAVEVRCLRFQDMDYDNEFDGVWACASLLHVPVCEMDSVFDKLRTALKEGGILYCSFKYGDTEREKDGRHFSYYTAETLSELLDRTGFSVIEMFESADVRTCREGEKWINSIASSEKNRDFRK